MKLCEAEINQTVKITEIQGEKEFVKRLSVLGVNVGEKVKIIRFSPNRHLIEIKVKDFLLAIRKVTALSILVERVSD